MTSFALLMITLFRFFLGKVVLELLPFIAECVTNIENKTNLTSLFQLGQGPTQAYTSTEMASSLKKRNNRSLEICIYFLEKLLKKDSDFIMPLLLCYLLCQGLSDVAADEVSVSVKEGDSVFLQPDVKTNQQDRIRWYFSDTRIAQMNGNFSKICTDVQCNEGNERFRGRLKLDHQTGSLNITNTRTTDSGLYHLQISSRNNSNNENIEEIFSVTVQSYFSASTDGVSVFVMERDSVTFQTGVETNQQGRIRWYFHDNRIAQITGNLSKICTDDQCKERFRDRLKLDHQTGSLNITNTTTTDSGLYTLIISSKINVEKDKTFKFALHDVSAAEQDEMKKEGENLTLSTGVINTNDEMRWYFDDSLIVEISGDQSKICTDDKERFRDRLKLDHQTGSLTITNTRTTDSGLYQLEISSSGKHTIHKSCTLSVSDKMKSVSVNKGDSVTLHTDLTEVHEDDVIQWRHGDTCVAEINKTVTQSSTCDGDAAGFRDRLKLDHQTGSLTITNTRTTDSGLYELKISSSSRRTINQRFTVTVIVRFLVMMEGNTVILSIDTEIQRHDEILWKFGGEVIPIDRFNRGVDSRWRNISVNYNGNLIIANIQSDQFGDYDVEIKNKSGLKKLQYKVKDGKVDDQTGN